METTTAAPPNAVATNYASFGSRLVAVIIDVIIIGVLQSVVIVPILGLIGISFIPALQNADNIDEDQAIGMVAAFMAAMGSLWLLSSAISFLYFSLMESSKFQGTLGKMALNIKVTDMNGDRISFGKAALRAVGRYVSGLIMCIGYLLAAFTEKKQALHDMIASTLVVKK
jgi:uncharacterized RDD family membrane protein YckC